MKFIIQNIEQKEYEGRKYAKANIVNEQEQEYEVSLGDKWGDKLATFRDGDNIEGNPWQNPKNGKWSLYPIEDRPKGKPNFDRIIEKKQQGIAEAQGEKAKNIALAQDRSSWMWSKNNATTLLASANLKDADFSNIDTMVEEMIRVATKIYNAEPTEPFN